MAGIRTVDVLKLLLCLGYDVADMTVGRLSFGIPFVGEIGGVALCTLLFGKSGIAYAVEALDPTEQIDGFMPTATIIAFAHLMRNRRKV